MTVNELNVLRDLGGQAELDRYKNLGANVYITEYGPTINDVRLVMRRKNIFVARTINHRFDKVSPVLLEFMYKYLLEKEKENENESIKVIYANDMNHI